METLHTSSIQINTYSTNSYEYSRSIMIRYLWILMLLIFQTYFFHNSQFKNIFQNLFSFPSTNFQVLQFSWNNNSKIYKVFLIFRYCFCFISVFVSKRSKFLPWRKPGTFHYLASANVQLQKRGAREQLSTRYHSCPMCSIQITVFAYSWF